MAYVFKGVLVEGHAYSFEVVAYVFKGVTE